MKQSTFCTATQNIVSYKSVQPTNVRTREEKKKATKQKKKVKKSFSTQKNKKKLRKLK